MVDDAVAVGPAVFIDDNGNATINYLSVDRLNDTIFAVTTAEGQLLVPTSAFTEGVPGVQLVPGSVEVSVSFARSQRLI